MLVEWSMLAKGDLSSLHSEIDKDNPKAADTILDKVRLAGKELVIFPKMGRKGKIKGTMEKIVLNTEYTIVYSIKKNTIYIVRVMHQSRQWPPSLDDEKTILELLQ